MRDYLRLTVALAVVWLLWSNHWEPLLLSLGAASVLVVVYLVHRMRLLDDEGSVVRQVRPIRLILYWPWLAGEVVKANLHVAARVLQRRISIEPRMIEVPADQKSALGKVIYANSITLTPGTISVDVDEEKNTILVHALTQATARDLLTGTMARRVQSLEQA